MMNHLIIYCKGCESIYIHSQGNILTNLFLGLFSSSRPTVCAAPVDIGIDL